MYHPWRMLRGLDDWLLEWDQLPEGISGEINWPTHTITIDPRLSQAQRRCTLAHELEHVVRGPGGGPREEREVEGMAARRLVELDALVDAVRWSPWPDEVADELWIDRAMLDARLSGLAPWEMTYITDRIDAE